MGRAGRSSEGRAAVGFAAALPIVIAGILLAAGLSRRMGRPKLLLPIEGRAVVRHAAEHIVDAGIERVIAVVGDEEAAVRSALAGLPIEIVVNPNPAAGQATSLVAGVEAVAPDVTAALIALGDQPFVPVSVIRGLIDAFERTSFAIAAPRYRGVLGNPVLFRRPVFDELRALSGDRGARSVVERVPARVALLDVDQPMPDDVDTEADYDRLRARAGVN